jgi:biotin carboxylase
VARALPAVVTIWAARTFGTAAHELAALRANRDCAVRLLVSHVRADSPTLSVADLAFLEPPLTGMAWVAWALEVCEREQVDVLWVTREAAAAAAARGAFEAVGTTLLVPSTEGMAATFAKSAVYRRAESLGLPTCTWRRAVGPTQAREAYELLLPQAEHGVCVKPDSGQGAVGVYRLVDDWDDLPVGVDLPVDRWLRHVEGAPNVAWLVLPWLPGVEHSVDILRSTTGPLASVVRTKHDTSYEQTAWYDAQLALMSEALLADLGVAPLGNVQWRESDDGPVLLEVNPRASAGLYRSSLALGADLLWAAMRLVLTGDAGLGDVARTVTSPVVTTALSGVVPLAVLGVAAPAHSRPNVTVAQVPHTEFEPLSLR